MAQSDYCVYRPRHGMKSNVFIAQYEWRKQVAAKSVRRSVLP
jgi:hypothetical protein